jgi:hypothetical protein
MSHQQQPTVAPAMEGGATTKSSWPVRLRVLLMVSTASIALGGCYGDPYQNPGFWHVTGAARENTAQQVADKSELIEGHGVATSNGVAAAAAVNLALGGAKGDAAGLQAPPKTISFSSSSGGS